MPRWPRASVSRVLDHVLARSGRGYDRGLRRPPRPTAAPGEVANTVSSVTGLWLGTTSNNHPGTNQAVTAAYSQPPSMAAGTLRSYLTANPTEYVLRGSWHRSVTSSGNATTRCFRLGTTNSWLADR